MFDVFTLFFIGCVIHSFETRLANPFWVIVAHLVWHCSCYWVTYLFWYCMTFWFVLCSVLSYRDCLTNSFRDILALGCISSVINGMAFDNWLWLNQRSRMSVCTKRTWHVSKRSRSVWGMMSNTFSKASPAPSLSIGISFGFSFGFSKPRRQKKTQGKENLRKDNDDMMCKLYSFSLLLPTV